MCVILLENQRADRLLLTQPIFMGRVITLLSVIWWSLVVDRVAAAVIVAVVAVRAVTCLELQH
jgi:hypothetical protein